MPGWYEKVKDLVADDKLVLLAVTQEQHADRCQLFAQWKSFDFPILHDPINLLASMAVPIVTAMDEHGVVRNTRPNPDWVRTTFVTESYPQQPSVPPAEKPDLQLLMRAVEDRPTAAAFRQLGDAAILWDTDVDLAVNSYNSALQRDASAVHHFRLGVALRRRHESRNRQQSDFARAVSHWTQALAMEPNQYIWRRRIQQYGPRLTKPYPFYDWVELAQMEIAARGEKPVSVKVPLSGAEVASPSKEFEIFERADAAPDPQGKILRDDGHYVETNVAIAPARIEAGQSIRLHLEFRLTGKAAWNNESEPLQVWFDEVAGWLPQQSLVRHEGSIEFPESTEVRRIEVEFQSSNTAVSDTIRGYATYYICDKATGTCMLRRQDLSFHAHIR